MAKIAAALGQPFMPWQRLVANVALELEPATLLPCFREVRLTVPRQSGKTTELLAVMVHRALGWGAPQRIIYTAQDRNYARQKWEEHIDTLDGSELRGLYKVVKTNGREAIVWRTKSRHGITASSETSGHGMTLDLGVIDEAFAQTDDRLVEAFRPAMLTRPKAQFWVCSTAGTDESTFLRERVDDGRLRAEAGDTRGVCYFEWSAPDDAEPGDPATWWACMPALGHTITEETIRAEYESVPADVFARSYLNRWVAGGAPALDPTAWSACASLSGQAGRVVAFGLDVTPARSMTAISVASRSPLNGRLHLEVLEHRAGTGWAVERALELYRRWHPVAFVVDPASPAGSLILELRAGGIPVEAIDARSYGQTCGSLYDGILEGKVEHRGQPALDAAVAGARKRPLGEAWAWSRLRSGSDISPLVAATLAAYGLGSAGEGEAQIL